MIQAAPGTDNRLFVNAVLWMIGLADDYSSKPEGSFLFSVAFSNLHSSR